MKCLVKWLIDIEVAYKMKIPPRMVAVHKTNRDGMLVHCVDVHVLLSNIFDIGWDDDEPKPVCSDGGTDDIESQELNERLAHDSDGMLAPCPNAMYLSLSSSHTNQSLACAAHEVYHSDTRMTVEGKLNKTKISAVDPCLGKAIDEGLAWTVIPKWVFMKFPQLAKLIQEAYNASGQLASGEGHMQVLKKLHGTWRILKAKTPEKHISFDNVKSIVARSRPKCMSILPYMYNFMLKCAGGDDAPLLSASEWYIKQRAKSTKTIAGDVYDALSCTDVKGGDGKSNGIMLFKNAIVKLLLTSNDYVIGDECRAISASKVRTMTAKKITKLVLEANTIMQTVRELAAVHDISPSKTVQIHAMDIALVRTVFGIKSAGQPVQSLQNIAIDCIESLNEISGADIVHHFVASDPADQAGPNVIANTTPAKRTAVMRDYTNTGEITATQFLLEKGFVVNQTVHRRADNIDATITHITDDGVKLRLSDGRLGNIKLCSFVNGEWEPRDAKAAAKEVKV